MNFLRGALVGVNTLLSIGNGWINNALCQIGDYVQENEHLSKFALMLFNSYVDTCILVKTHYEHLYNNSPVFCKIVNYLHYGKRYINAHINQYKIEPYSDNWVSMHILVKNNNMFKGSKFIHFENYLTLLDEVSPKNSYNEKIETGFMYVYNIVLSLVSSLLHVIDAIVVMKDGDRYIVRSMLSKHDTFSHESSKHVFLSVEYSHPNMEKPIPIEFPEEMYEIGNVVFTPMFVKRCLEYQIDTYVFDENYSINIIDCDANMVSLNSKQYGILLERGWDIMDLSKEESKKESKEEPKEEPKEESKEEPKEESKEEPKEESKEEENE